MDVIVSGLKDKLNKVRRCVFYRKPVSFNEHRNFPNGNITYIQITTCIFNCLLGFRR